MPVLTRTTPSNVDDPNGFSSSRLDLTAEKNQWLDTAPLGTGQLDELGILPISKFRWKVSYLEGLLVVHDPHADSLALDYTLAQVTGESRGSFRTLCTPIAIAALAVFKSGVEGLRGWGEHGIRMLQLELWWPNRRVKADDWLLVDQCLPVWIYTLPAHAE